MRIDRVWSFMIFLLIVLVITFGLPGILYWVAGDMWLRNPLVLSMICIVIGWHEFGHFLFARLAHIGVQEYSIGIGPDLLKFRIGETRFHFRAIPIGGYVDTADWNDNEDGEDLEALHAEERRMVKDHTRWFSAQPLGERLAMIIAGPGFNLVLAGSIFLAVGSAFPVDSPWAYVQAVWNPEVRGLIYGLSDYEPKYTFQILDRLDDAMIAYGVAGFLRYFAMLNMTLGILNLLPIPPLDGGVIVRELLYEWFIGYHPIQGRVPYLRTLSTIWGGVSLIGLLLFVTFQLIF